MQTRVFDGNNLDALQEHLSAVTPGLRIIAPSGAKPTFHVRAVLAQIGALSIWRNDYGEGFGVINPIKPDNLLISIPTRGGLDLNYRGIESISPGQLLTYLTREIEQINIKPQTQADSLGIPIATLNTRLAQLLDRPVRQPVHFHPVVETAEGGGAAVRHVLRGLLFATSSEQRTRSTSALLRLSTALIDLVLESLPHTYSEALHQPPPRIAPRQVRRALAYIRDSPMPPLTTDELAVICGVSVRSLQYAFRAFVGVAPSEYWRRVRLDHAVQQIKREKPESAARIAASWGFANITRFRSLCTQVGVDLDEA